MKIDDQSFRYNIIRPATDLEYPAKINVHIPVRGSAEIFVRELNSTIAQWTDTDVDFRPPSFQVPHITLYMGFVMSWPNLGGLLEAAAELSQQIRPIDVSLGKPYLKRSAHGAYIFLDAEPLKGLLALKRMVFERIGEFFQPLEWDVVSEPPHLTVGYVKRDFERIDHLLRTYSVNPPQLKGTAFEVSFAGGRGACLGTIRSFELNGR